MKEKNIFIGILIVALIAVGVFVYRTAYKGTERVVQITPVTGEAPAAVPQVQSPGVVPQASAVATPRPSTGAVVTGKPTLPNKIVQFNGNGFVPQSTTIKKGTTVAFANANIKNIWIASNPHPTHTDYPGFDSLKAIAPGNAYSFTFDRVGTWGYHNHLNPAQHGSIIVTE